MLPPAPRAPKRGTAHAIAGVYLLPAGMQTQCQARQLDSAMAKCIAGEACCCLMDLVIGASFMSLLTTCLFTPLPLLADALRAI